MAAFADQDRGFFVDVGAFDGVHLSNTLALERQGWTGYCIEPVPWVYALLSRNRPNSLCVNAAAGAEPGEATMVVDPTALLGSLAGESVVHDAYEVAAQLRGLDQEPLDELTVTVVTLNDLLRKHSRPPTIDVVSIDVEGFEMSVLAGFDLEIHKPRVVIAEANDPQSERELLDHFDASGYTHCRALARNHFFAYEKHLIRRLRTTAIDCYLPINLHPLGEMYTHPNQRVDRVIAHGSSLTWATLIETFSQPLDISPGGSR